jgi:DNA-binding LacI/PurR family transcriptional regulator/DNA-binding transcriptional regulator YhcF (GntR family)
MREVFVRGRWRFQMKPHMTKGKFPGSTTRARTFLEKSITKLESSGQKKLPSLRTLSACAHVAPVAMSAALHELQRRGAVTIAGRSGVFVGNVGPESLISPAQKKPKWQEIAVQFERDIHAGLFPETGQLPAFAGLRARYGISDFTLHRMFASLTADGIIERFGKGYRVRPSPLHQGFASVAVLGPANSSGELSVINSRFEQALVTLDIERRRTGIRFVHVPVQARIIHSLVQASRTSRDYLGFFIWANGIQPDLLRALETGLRSRGRPVAIIDETGDLNVTEHPSVRAFTIAAHGAGKQTGRFLLGLGHRRIAWINPYPGLRWSVRREEGLRKSFEDAGYRGENDGVKGYNLDANAGNGLVDSATESLVDDFLATFARGVDSKITAFELQAHNFNIGLFRHYEQLWRAMEPVFEQALSCGASAWVLPNDQCAFFALRFLRNRKVAVPGRISICGFDDTWVAVQSGLTSYNFAIFNVVQQAVGFIRYPESKLYADLRKRECDGFVIQRRSCTRYRG